METTTTTTMKTKTLFDRVQYDIIGTDIGHRGMKPLIVPGDLEHAARCIVDTLRTPPRGASSSSSSSCSGETTILVLSGFPCCVTQVPPTETDGPPGTYAIVRAVYQLATQQRNSSTNHTTPQQQPQPPGTTHIIVVTDDCNRAVFAAGLENLALSNTAEDDQDQDDQDLNDPKNMKDRVTINNNTNTGKTTHFPQHTTTTSSSRCTISLETFPASAGFTSHDHARLEHLATTTDLIISCERAGPAKDGNCYTMKGINMNEHNLIAPLEQLLTRRRRSSSSSRPKFIAIGDGGNELGMGKVLEHIRQNNPLIDQGDKIGCVVPADYLIAASVSNWGGYALAACVAVVAVTIQTKTSTSTSTRTTTTLDAITHQLDQCLPTIEQEHALLQRCVEAGCRDGVSGQRACTVDGMPFETSMDCLTAIRRTILEYYTTIG